MPVIQRIEADNYKICLWSIKESADQLIALSLPSNRAIAGAIQHEQRQREWLACRAALENLEGNKTETLYKDEHGKPHLQDGNFISLSHTAGYAVAMSGAKPVGIDIEMISNRILRIANRFLHPEEQAWLSKDNNLNELYLIWCAKEAMYKLYGKQAISFKEHFRVQPISEIKSKGEFFIKFLKGTEKIFHAQYRIIDGHALVWVVAP